VDEGERAVVTRMGAIARTAPPGAHLKLPLIESVVRVSVRTNCVEWRQDGQRDSRMQTYSRDQQLAHLSVKVCYRVGSTPEAVRTMYAQFRGTDGYEHAVVVPRTFVAVKEVFGQYNAIRVVQDRAAFNRQVEEQLRREIAANNGGDAVVVDSVSVQDIAFSQAYEHAVEERMKAEVEVARVTQNLEREKKEGEIAVVKATAAANSELARARAEAQAIQMKGEAEGAAIRARSAALKDSPKLVELTAVEKWDGKLPATMVPGAALPFVNVHR
jgi:regulator of protease activity HflC (stomatin/prohibitin superfamily)